MWPRGTGAAEGPAGFHSGAGGGALSALGTPQGLAFVNKAAPVAGESPQSENLLQCGKRRL